MSQQNSTLHRTPFEQLSAVKEDILSLVMMLDLQVKSDLGAQDGPNLHEWKEALLAELMTENMKRRGNTIQRLRALASWARLTDTSIISEDLAHITSRSGRLAQKRDEIIAYYGCIQPYMGQESQASFTAELDNLRSILADNDERKELLCTVFSNLKMYIGYLAQPKDQFERAIAFLNVDMDFVRRQVFDAICDRLALMSEEHIHACQVISSAVDAASTEWASGSITPQVQLGTLLSMQMLRNNLLGQQSLQATLITEVKNFQDQAREAPHFLPDGEEGCISIEDLMQAKEMHTRLQCRVLELHEVRKIQPSVSVLF
ncbi:hypothetical protein BV20DRAFT_1054665 [Pilatotrama ljubarskyi]|nr:hypothetical protein BV20DRAFT_1054665 [Pilatotrama ljubarskyi]